MASSNHFLDSLSASDQAALEPALSRIELERDRMLVDVGEPVPMVWLPIASIVSVVAVVKDGRSMETRTIGRESGFGLLHALGSRISFERVMVQVGGPAWGLPIEVLSRETQRRPALVDTVARHAQATLAVAAQSIACNSLHSAEQRLCRWLLLTQDRLGSDVVPLTQEHLAIMLGVQRTTVTAIALLLQERGLISYTRGRIRVLDRDGLGRCACECYAMMQRFSARALGEPPQSLMA